MMGSLLLALVAWNFYVGGADWLFLSDGIGAGDFFLLAVVLWVYSLECSN